MRVLEVLQRGEWENVEYPHGYEKAEHDFLVKKLHAQRLRRNMIRRKLAELGLTIGNTDSPHEWIELNGSVPNTASIMVITEPKNTKPIKKLVAQFNKLQDLTRDVHRRIKEIETRDSGIKSLRKTPL